MAFITVNAAYGRSYKSAKAVKADFDAGKDFVIVDVSSPHYGGYVNKADLAPGDSLHVYFDNDRKSTVLKRGK